MRFLTFLGLMFMSFSVVAEDNIDSCEAILARLEINQQESDTLYDQCGFNDEKTVWEKWAGYATVNKMSRALYEICVRYPEHIYHDMYCERSAGLGYGPALVLLGQKAFQEGDFKKSTNLFVSALNSKELNTKQEAQILETLGLQAVKEDDTEKALAYFKKAAQKGSALANNFLGVHTYINASDTPTQKKVAFDYFWRAILLGCKVAEENLGLFHLVRLKKLPIEDALKIMQMNAQVCERKSEVPQVFDDSLLSCQCQTILRDYERLQKQPYMLVGIEDVQAQLKKQDGTTLMVSKGDVLDNGFRVDDMRKTALILTRGRGERIILNLFTDQACQKFCEEHKISDNLSKNEMLAHINKKSAVKVQPYHLTFTPQECELINYYAPQYVDVSLPYTGKEECKNVAIEQQKRAPIDELLNEAEVEEVVEDKLFVPYEEEFENRSLSDGEKAYFLELGAIVEQENNDRKK